jgi:predicted transcriptional regulator
LSKRFVQFVQENPGLRIEQINKQLGTSTSALALPIRKLLASGDISVKGQKRSTAYFAGKRAAEPAARTAGKGSTAGKTRKGKASKKSARSKKSGTGRSKSKKK